MASTYLSRTPASAGNSTTWTYSCWVKLEVPSTGTQQLLDVNDGTYSNGLRLTATGLRATNYNPSYAWNIRTNRLLRDTNAWYHIVLRVDTTQATSSDRVRLYINGVQETSFLEETYPSQNATNYVNTTTPHYIGSHQGTAYYFGGCMSHIHLCDGQSYDPSAFGETDTATGIWKPKTTPSVTYGTNGFFLKFENSASFGTDSSPNANNFTVNGTMTQTIDTPSNVFAVCNKLVNTNSALSFSNGNTTITNSGQWLGTLATLGMSAGKYYWEFKSTGNFMTGVSQLNSSATETNQLNTANLGYSSRFATGYEMINGGNLSNNNNTSTPYGTSHSSGDIGMVAFDADNGTLWLGKNGTWHNSATQIEIENGTTTNSAYTGLTNSNGYIPSFSTENSTLHLNFGNGYFGTTAVSSAENPDDGIGIFEYEVPAGYKALCTKSINAQEYS